MSADNIGDCPACGERELREFWEFYAEELGEDRKPTAISMNYTCRCRGCNYRDRFRAYHTYRTIQ